VLLWHPAAIAEARAAYAWYLDAADAAVALRFQEALERAVSQIEAAPERWPVVRGCVRRKQLGRPFPYSILELIDAGALVTALMHQKQKPGYWAKRTR
jgi:plasmid stabilization system protein ParE